MAKENARLLGRCVPRMKCGGCARTSLTAEDFESRLVRGVPTPYKSCRKCRAKATKRNNDPAVKARKKILKPKYKDAQDAYNHRPDVKAARKACLGAPEYLAKRKEVRKQPEKVAVLKAYEASEAGKLSRKGRNARSYIKRMADPGLHIGDRIRQKLVKMLHGSGQSSTVSTWTEFDLPKDIQEHFEGQFATGMSWDNYGHGDDKWNIGHRIARALYDQSNPEDVRRCWSKKNLFPQWQPENLSLGTTLPPPDVLAELADVHPIAWSV